MELLIAAIVLFLAVVASDWIARALPLPVPLPLVQIAIGGALSHATSFEIQIEPHLFLLVFLPPLLFLEAWRIPKNDFASDLPVISGLAMGLVLLSVLGIGWLIHWLFPGMPLAVAFALAAILSPTDPVAVGAIAKKAPLPRRLLHILEGESLLNDATGLVCMKFAIAAALTGAFSITEASTSFLWMALAGLGIGGAVIAVSNFLYARIGIRLGEEPGAKILLGLLLPFIAYLAAEHVHASGILAAVGAGIAMAYMENRTRTLAVTRLRRTAVWDTIQFALNGGMFVLAGEQMPTMLRSGAAALREAEIGGLNTILMGIVVITLAMILLRAAWVWISFSVFMFRWGQARPARFVQLVLASSFAGVRGTITLAGVMTFPLMAGGAPFPGRDLAVALAGGVVILSLVLAGLFLPPLLRGLKMPEKGTQERDERRARKVAALEAIDAIERLQAERFEAADHARSAREIDWLEVAGRVSSDYRGRLEEVETSAEEAEHRQAVAGIERTILSHALAAERAAYFRLGRERKISDALARALVAEIDHAEVRISAAGREAHA